MAVQTAEKIQGARMQAGGSEEAEVRKLVCDAIEAWNEHDVRAYSRLYAEDAEITTVIGTAAHGRYAIYAHIAEVFETLFKRSHLIAKNINVRFLSPEIAVVDVLWRMTGALDWEGKVIPTREGLLHWIVTRQDGRWLITVMHNQELTPLRY